MVQSSSMLKERYNRHANQIDKQIKDYVIMSYPHHVP